MKIQIRNDNDPKLRQTLFDDDGVYPHMIHVETSDGQVFQIIERHRGRIELAAVRNKNNHAAALTILPRSSNLVEIRATRL